MMPNDVTLLVPRGLADAAEGEAARMGKQVDGWIESVLLSACQLDRFGAANSPPVLPLPGPYAPAEPIRLRVRSDVTARITAAARLAGVSRRFDCR